MRIIITCACTILKSTMLSCLCLVTISNIVIVWEIISPVSAHTATYAGVDLPCTGMRLFDVF